VRRHGGGVIGETGRRVQVGLLLRDRRPLDVGDTTGR
jgi:hypothetical protein